MNTPTDITDTKKDYNGISTGNADEDGIFIKETISGNTVYIYYSEIDTIIQQMRKLAYDNKRLHSEDRVSTKETEGVVSSRGLNNLSKLSDYYKSEEWQQKRTARLKRDAFRCVNCGGTVGLEVHHKGYRGLCGGDDVDDLRTLCHRCHRNVTQLARNKRRGVYLG